MTTRTKRRYEKHTPVDTTVNQPNPHDFVNTTPFVAAISAFRLGKDTGVVFVYLIGEYGELRRAAFNAAKFDTGRAVDLAIHATTTKIAESVDVLRQNVGSALKKLEAAGLIHRNKARIVLDFGERWHQWTIGPLLQPPASGDDVPTFEGIRANAFIRYLHIPTVIKCAQRGGKNCAIDYLHRALIHSLSDPKHTGVRETVQKAGPRLYKDTNTRRVRRKNAEHPQILVVRPPPKEKK